MSFETPKARVELAERLRPASGTIAAWRTSARGGALSRTDLDDHSGLTLVKEWFIDKRPEVYALEGEHEGVTEAQALAMFGGG